MSRPVKILWPVTNTQAVCLNQTLGAAGYLNINGSLASDINNPPRFVKFDNIARQITLTSTANLSGIQFTIIGLDEYGNEDVVQINGPNNNTVNTGASLFSVVQSVFANAAVGTNVSVGTGTVGATVWIRSDYQRSVNNFVVSVDVTGTINYSFETVLYDPNLLEGDAIIHPIDGVTIPTIPTATPMTNCTVDCTASYNFPTHSSRIYVNSSDGTGSLKIYFIQQGIT